MITARVLQTIRKNNMISSGDAVIVGASGGIDSTALLLMLKTFEKELGIKLYAAHLNHMIRGKESNRDEAFTKKLAKKLAIPVIAESFDVPAFAKSKKLNLEDAARRVRYEFFDRAAARVGANKIAVAHTADDNIETFLMRLIRGTGLKGLEGIPPVRGRIIRPLIDIQRSELEAYLKNKGIKARLDSSNLDTDYLRNSVRHKLIPMLSGYNKNIKEGLLRTIRSMRVDYSFIEEMARRSYESLKKKVGGAVTIDVGGLDSLHPSLKAGVMRLAIQDVKKDLVDVSYVNVEDALKLTTKKSAGIDIAGAYIEVKRGRMTFSSSRPKANATKGFLYKLEVPGEVLIKESGIVIGADEQDIADVRGIKKKDPYRAFMDRDKICGPLMVRSRRPGDYFSPLGMKGRKKLQDVFVDEKLDIDERDKVPVVDDGEKIIWVAGYRISEKVKVDRNTRRVVELNYKANIK